MINNQWKKWKINNNNTKQKKKKSVKREKRKQYESGNMVKKIIAKTNAEKINENEEMVKREKKESNR